MSAYTEGDPMALRLRELLRPVPVAPTKAPNGTPFSERLARRIDYQGGASLWIWRGPLNDDGYGKIMCRDRRNRYVHRVVYELLVGPIPEGHELDHLCRVRSCSNPGCLEPVTHDVNILRGESPSAHHARKTHCPQGHEYTPDNIYGRPGHRLCKACTTRRNRERGMT